MNKFFTLLSASFLVMGAYGQSVAVFSGNTKVMARNVQAIDSIVFYTDNQTVTHPEILNQRVIDAHWCALGTSITWYNDHVERGQGKFTEGYSTRVMKELKFTRFTNQGISGGTLSSALNQVVYADYYTIEHGINDWGKSVKPGTFNDYLNDSRNGTFAATYRQLIDAIYQANPNAKIVLCTPRKGYGFNEFLPAHWYDAKNGIYLKDYAELVRQIAEHEGLPVADFFAECGGQHNLAQLSIDTALHPNDTGYQLMANVLIQAFKKALVD